MSESSRLNWESYLEYVSYLAGRSHRKAVAMRAAWCAKQSPKAAPLKSWYAELAGKAEAQLLAALHEDSSAMFGSGQ